MCRLFFLLHRTPHTGTYSKQWLNSCMPHLFMRSATHSSNRCVAVWRLHTNIPIVSQIYLSALVFLSLVSSISLQHCNELQVFSLLRPRFGLCDCSLRLLYSWHDVWLNYFHAMRCVTMIYLFTASTESLIASSTEKSRRKSQLCIRYTTHWKTSAQLTIPLIFVFAFAFDCCHSEYHFCFSLFDCLCRSIFSQSQPMFVQSTWINFNFMNKQIA